MSRRSFIAALALSAIVSPALAEDSLAEALARLRASGPEGRAAAIADVMGFEPSATAIAEALDGGLPPPEVTAGWSVRSAVDTEGVARPYHLYVPELAIDDEVPVPLLVDMHGGVNRPEFIDAERFARSRGAWTETADEFGFVVALPLGRRDCAWWSDAGVRHVRATIRDAKRFAPIDDDRIIGTGFSDGGSGSYYLAMAAPDPFAAFMPMNGHPAIAVMASRKQLYLQNAARVPLFVAMTQDDQLYAGKTVLPHVQKLFDLDAPVHLVSYPFGGHSPSYADDQQMAFANFIMTAERGPSASVEWWTATPELGRAAWLEVLELGSGVGESELPDDVNVMSRPGRVRLGFSVDTTFKGAGVKVQGVKDGSLGEEMGLTAGDVIVMIDGVSIPNYPVLRGALGAKSHGEGIAVGVAREEPATLKARIPAFTPRPIYGRDAPTAWTRVARDGLRFSVETHGVRRLRLHLSPQDVGDAATVSVTLNGSTTPLTLKVRADVPALVAHYARDADARLLFASFVDVEVPVPKDE